MALSELFNFATSQSARERDGYPDNSRYKNLGKHGRRKVEKSCVTFLPCDPAGTSTSLTSRINGMTTHTRARARKAQIIVAGGHPSLPQYVFLLPDERICPRLKFTAGDTIRTAPLNQRFSKEKATTSTIIYIPRTS